MFALLYSRVGAGAAGAASKFSPEPEPHKNDATPQHCYLVSQTGFASSFSLLVPELNHTLLIMP
jgi:hypothetical protein